MSRTLALILTLISATAHAAINDPVKLDAGQVIGITASNPEMRIYKGIPFAAPPVGSLRWRAPQPVTHWEGIRKADEFGPICMQDTPGGAVQKMSEDCLYLNVWTTAKSAGDKRPVMVWIYGGGYNIGSGSQPEYDGEMLAKKGVVVVTLNYRLGVFGFFSYPELTKDSAGRAAGNFGVMDAIAALQWVQKNIAAFGGDPNRVTVFGESAGSGLIANLMAAPQAKGLFHRAIGESSGWSGTTIKRIGTLVDAEHAGVKFAESLGAKSLTELRALPADQILKGGRGTGPIVDGWLIPEDPGFAFLEGRHIDVPVLVGSNRDESFSVNPRDASQFAEQARRRFGDLADTFLKLYPAGSDDHAHDSAFLAGRDEVAFVMRNWSHLEAKTGKSRAYLYYFTRQPPVAANTRNGDWGTTKFGKAVHTAEIPYVFNNLGPNPVPGVDRQLADAMSSYWVNFAANGDPNGTGLPKWPAFDEKNTRVMNFGDGPKAATAPLNESQKAFFETYFDKLYGK
jgi:para-nitrobenzyl esterase